ncbi:MAG: class I SAM-dependent methyltransferase [Phycisphaerales bacterium]
MEHPRPKLDGQPIVEDKRSRVAPMQIDGSSKGGGVTTVSVGESAEYAAQFESIYQVAAGDAAKVPWGKERASPHMVSWLNAEAPGVVRPGSRAIVVGCGLGDDVVELLSRGYDAIGFDVSPTAVSWARKRFPEYASQFAVADLFALPGKFRGRFDLVIEISTLQALDPVMREKAASSVASLVGPQGHVLAICRGRGEGQLLEHVTGPPWPLTCGELTGLMEASGLRLYRPLDEIVEEDAISNRRLRGVFVRP